MRVICMFLPLILSFEGRRGEGRSSCCLLPHCGGEDGEVEEESRVSVVGVVAIAVSIIYLFACVLISTLESLEIAH